MATGNQFVNNLLRSKTAKGGGGSSIENADPSKRADMALDAAITGIAGLAEVVATLSEGDESDVPAEFDDDVLERISTDLEEVRQWVDGLLEEAGYPPTTPVEGIEDIDEDE